MLHEYWASAASAVATLNRYYNDLGTKRSTDSLRHKNTYMCIYSEQEANISAPWQYKHFDAEEESKINVWAREKAI